jgi:hypothetical protein
MISHISATGPATAYQRQQTGPSVKNTTPPPETSPAPASDTLTLNRTAGTPGTYGPDSTDNLRQLIVNLFREQDLIAEDGYFGVEQTSDRIFETAVALAGNDPEKLEQIRAGIDKGFEMAAQALGGTLPDISTRTYDAVMEKLDAWANGEPAA